jgi:hypothetical protein
MDMFFKIFLKLKLFTLFSCLLGFCLFVESPQGQAATQLVSASPQHRVGREVNPPVGKDVAADYMSTRNPTREEETGRQSHYLAIHGGRLMSGDAWEWGQRNKQSQTGSYSAGVTYRVKEWGTMDLNVRIDFNEYKILEETPLKMSLMPLLIFPDASSKFPLYFGVGGGPGIFFKQLADESQIAFDYQILMGARFFDIVNQAGFFVETGMKNHLLVLTSGQFNGVFLTSGAVFTF